MRNLLTLCLVLLLAVTGCSREETFPAIPADAPFVATLNIREGSISFLDKNGDLLTKWKLDKAYTGGTLLEDGDTLLLYGTELEQTDLYSLKEGGKIGEFDTGKGIVNGLYLGDQGLFAFADKNKNEIRFFAKDGKKATAVGTESYPMSLAADGNRLYVASYKGDCLQVINMKTMKVESSIPIHPSAAGMLLRPEEREVWIGGHGSGDRPQSSIYIYSLDDLSLKKELPAPLMPVNFFENEHGIYALSHGTNKLYRFNRDRELIQSLEVGANPFSVGFFDGKVVVAGYDSDELYWIDAERLRLTRQVKVGKGPFIIFSREKVN